MRLIVILRCFDFFALTGRIWAPVLLFLVWFGGSAAGQTVRINEIMSSNAATVTDDDGDYSDWIELYNAGTGIINLVGWGLSDSYASPFKWVFPDVSVGPGQFLLVWASGKDRRPAQGEWVNGVMREVFGNITGTKISSLTQHSAYPDHPASSRLLTRYFEAPVDESDNYGQKIHGYLQAPATGSYTFWISSDDNGQLWLSDDETPGNLRLIAEVPSWTTNRQWDKYTQQKSAPVNLEKGKRYYIMALAKEGTGGDNLAIGWQWPDGTLERPIPGEHLFWPEGYLHTNFSISAGGEEILLTTPAGTMADDFAPHALSSGYSFGRRPDGAPEVGYFPDPTPGKPNGPVSYTGILNPPVFSHPGGFYGTPFSLSLSATQPGATIVYTLDGSDPDAANLSGITYSYKNQYPQNPGSPTGQPLSRSFRSNLYAAPVAIRDRTPEANEVSRISSTYNSVPGYFPSEPIDKAMVVRARTEKKGALSSPVVTNTYFVRNGGLNAYPLPVISISVQEDRMFDFYQGIYVAGTDFEYWRSGNPSATAEGGSPANYHREGDEWEYPAHLELFEPSGNRVLGQNAGFRMHGAWSRAHPFKSLRIYARNEYGKGSLDYPFFKDQESTIFKRIVLRNSGNDAYQTLFRDAALEKMVSHMRFEIQDYQPAIMFLNGEYWGIHNIRERLDKHYLARKFGVNEEHLDILEDDMTVVEGDNQHYAETLNYLEQNGVLSGEQYAYILTRLDAESYIDYMVAQIFIVNTDWPGNNIKYWRLRTPEYLPGAAPGRDGRWRWMLFDADFGFGIYTSSDYTKNMMTFCTQTNGPSWPNPPWSTLLFRKMLENSTFRNEFVVRFCDQLNTAFRPEVVKALINSIKTTIEPEMDRQVRRWKMPGSLSSWNNYVGVMLNFADFRPAYTRTHLRQYFGLSGDYTLTVDVSDPGQGYVIVNTIPLTKETKGVSENPYPWQGTYFRNIPLRLEAVAAAGYEFVHWECNQTTCAEPVVQLTPSENCSYKAVFMKSTKQEEIIHYWNFNESGTPLIPAYTLLTADLQVALPDGGSAWTDTGTGENFIAGNAQFGDPAGNHFRINQPLGVALTFEVPTTGYKNLSFRYETRRSEQGAGIQVLSYSTNGTDFYEIRRIMIKDGNPAVITLDLNRIAGAVDNPSFRIRIGFERGEGGTTGNNRIDNVTLSGYPVKAVTAPQVAASEKESSLRGTAFPNPFREYTTFCLQLSRTEKVDAGLYDLAGRRVATLVKEVLPAGSSHFRIDGNSLPPGVYLLICRGESGTCTQKMIRQP